nr:hypothetical protein TetV2_00623 [Oceanusvirus sp.]
MTLIVTPIRVFGLSALLAVVYYSALTIQEARYAANHCYVDAVKITNHPCGDIRLEDDQRIKKISRVAERIVKNIDPPYHVNRTDWFDYLFLKPLYLSGHVGGIALLHIDILPPQEEDAHLEPDVHTLSKIVTRMHKERLIQMWCYDFHTPSLNFDEDAFYEKTVKFLRERLIKRFHVHSEEWYDVFYAMFNGKQKIESNTG